MKKAINKLSAALLTAQFAFKKRLKNKLKDNRGVVEYGIKLAITVALSAILLIGLTALIKGPILEGLTNKINEFMA